jgi:hypothetical protein
LANDYLPQTFGVNWVRTIREAIENVMAAHERRAQTVKMLPLARVQLPAAPRPAESRIAAGVSGGGLRPQGYPRRAAPAPIRGTLRTFLLSGRRLRGRPHFSCRLFTKAIRDVRFHSL